MKHTNRLHYIFLTLTVAWMVIIFIFSSQNGESSSNTSGFIVNFIASIFVPDLEEYNITRQQEILDTISFIIRKGAHFTEYAILGLFSFLSAISYTWKKTATCSYNDCYQSLHSLRLKCIVGSLVFSCLYAISDELHQGFVADRSPSLRDVCIDTCGAFAGILFIYFLLSLYLKKKSR